MKKIILSAAMIFALSVSFGAMAQDNKKAQEKTKTECCQQKKDNTSCCKKDEKKDKASCCTEKAAEKADKKATPEKK